MLQAYALQIEKFRDLIHQIKQEQKKKKKSERDPINQPSQLSSYLQIELPPNNLIGIISRLKLILQPKIGPLLSSIYLYTTSELHGK